MRRLIALLFSLILAAFLISCSNSIAQESSITIDAGQAVSKAITVSRTIKNRTIPQKGESDLTDAQLAALDKAMELSVDLKVGVTGEFEKSVENNYSFSLSQMEDPNPQNIIPVDKIRITSIPVGKKVKVTAQLIVSTKIKDASALVEFALAEEDSELSDLPEEMLEEYILSEFGFYNYAFIGESQQITIHEGENPVSVPLQFDENYEWEEGDDEDGISGEIEPVLPEKLTIQIDEEASDAKLYLNDGKIAFKLLDESGNALEPDPNSNHDYCAIWNFKLSLKGTEIPATGDASTYYKQTYSPNSTAGTIEFKDLPAGGTYQLYVQATPTVTQYVSSATTSAVFDVKVDTAYYTFDAGNILNDPNQTNYTPSSNFADFIDSISSNAVVKITGETVSVYDRIFKCISRYLCGTEQNPKTYSYLIDFDFSEMTTSSEDSEAKTLSYTSFLDCKALHSIILPEDLTKIEDQVFQNCSNLEEVIIGENLVQIGGSVFNGAEKVKSLTLPASFIAVGIGSFSNLENLTLADESGTWYYTDSQSDWQKWVSHVLTPPTINDEFSEAGTLDSLEDSEDDELADFPVNGTVSEKLLFVAVNKPGYTFYCVK